jgi:uncharacterized protein (TIGR00266 family)
MLRCTGPTRIRVLNENHFILEEAIGNMSLLVSTIRKISQQLGFRQYAGAARALVILAEYSRNNVYKFMKVSEMNRFERKGNGKIVVQSNMCRNKSCEPSQEIWTSAIGENITASSRGVIAAPIDFDRASRIEGKECETVTVDLQPNQILRAESGAMMYMTQGVSMETSTGGVVAGMKRMMTGQNFFWSDYRYTGAEGTTGQVCLGSEFPSKIIRLDLDEYDGKIVCQQGALLCASHTVDIEMEFAKKVSTGFFGGEGFILQGLLGTGSVFVKAGGAIIRKELKDGDSLCISSGCLVAFTPQVTYDIQVMRGFKNVLFGGEGLFLSTLTGPGIVWLQALPPHRMVSEIARRFPVTGRHGR